MKEKICSHWYVEPKAGSRANAIFFKRLNLSSDGGHTVKKDIYRELKRRSQECSRNMVTLLVDCSYTCWAPVSWGSVSLIRLIRQKLRP
ncbi:hypothetical protein TNCV_1230671 [Trichonephila clavipes]|nr:hypothetical protein TNCV_1230671 [Trichonephila clavipes]